MLNLIVTRLSERHSSRFGLNFHTISHVNIKCNSAGWARLPIFRRPWVFRLHTCLFFFSPQVWTEPAPFLVRPITTKAWPPLDLVPSLVGVTVKALTFQPSSICMSYAFWWLSVCSPSIPASTSKSCRDHSDKSPFVMAAWFWRRLPNNPLFCSGKATLNKWDRWMPQRAEKNHCHCLPCMLANTSLFFCLQDSNNQSLTFDMPNFKVKRACFSYLNSSHTPPCFIHRLVDQVSLWENGLLD